MLTDIELKNESWKMKKNLAVKQLFCGGAWDEKYWPN